MIKIMIVDDMPLFLEYLRGCIDWAAYGFEICAEAHDGREALQKIEEYYPDIVLTDITMPYVNGLELSETIVQQYPDIAVILITGNNEFEYARKAVKIGVCDYIVKPFEKEELILSLLKLQDNINRALEQKSRTEELERARKEEILRRILFARADKEKEWYEEQFADCGMEIANEYFMVSTMKLKNSNGSDIENIMNWEQILMNLLLGMLVIDGSYEIFRDFENHIVMLMNFNSEEAMKDFKLYELDDLIQIVKNQLHLESMIAVSDYCYAMGDIKSEYQHTIQIISQKENECLGKVWDYKKVKLKQTEAFYSLDTIPQLNQALEALNESRVREIIEEEWTRIHAYGDNIADMNFLSSLMSVLLTNIVNAGRTVENIYGEGFSPYESIRQIDDPTKRKDTMIEYCIQRITYEKSNSNTRSHATVEAAKEYIEQHYMDTEMNIMDISKALLVNQTYLRKMFKSEMNMTLLEYITKYRMHIAKKMILNTDEKLTQISEQVGYSDISYFSKCFKKYYGVSPKNMSVEGR